jgi:acyl-CoA thioesterase-2
MSSAVSRLLELLDLETLDRDLYRGHSPDDGWKRIFGGQVIAQGLVAAARAAEGRPIHSLHAYFMRPGDPRRPILYRVERIFEGRSFLTRRVSALQNGAEILSLTASFQVPEAGLDHHVPPPPDVPMPETLPDPAEAARRMPPHAPVGLKRFFEEDRAIELRPVDYAHYLTHDPLPSRFPVWLRAAAALPDDPIVHAAVFAYASDMTLLDSTLCAHGRSFFDQDLQMASLDHAIWFHAPFRADDWLLHAQDSPATGGGRGFARGLVHTRDGRLVASTAQEGLIRVRPERTSA